MVDYLEFCEMPTIWQPCHIARIVTYLKGRGYDIDVYKELDCSKYILKFKYISGDFKSCKEIGEALFPIYCEERDKEHAEFIKERNERERLNTLLEERILKNKGL